MECADAAFNQASCKHFMFSHEYSVSKPCFCCSEHTHEASDFYTMYVTCNEDLATIVDGYPTCAEAQEEVAYNDCVENLGKEEKTR